MRRLRFASLGLVAAAVALAPVAIAETTSDTPPREQKGAAVPEGSGQAGLSTLTIFLRHDESQTLDAINQRLRDQHFYERFPPKGVEVVSWSVLMGIGQVVTLRFPAERLREINRALEQTAWGGYRTEFYPTYDYRPTAAKEREGLPSEFH